jgi:LysM repeat protein
MRVRTWSACVALAWGIVLIVTAAGPPGPLRPAQANTRTATTTSSTSTTSSTTTTTTIQATLTSSATTGNSARPGAGTRPGGGARTSGGAYVVRPGDTLSGIAAALGAPGGWPALYAANRRAVGPDPGLIRPGTVLALPGRATPARYAVAAGDTLSGIASALDAPGGWRALYAANRRVIGADPNAIRPGTVLAIPRAASSGSPAPHPTPTPAKARSSGQPPASARPPASAPTGTPASARPPAPGRASAPASAPTPAHGAGHAPSAQAPSLGGLPRWLEIVLAAAGLLIATAFLTEPALAIARRRRAARPADDPRIVLADYERLVVTHSRQDGTVYVLRPPDADPQAILLAARLVLAQDRYEELAGHLGVPAHWPTE